MVAKRHGEFLGMQRDEMSCCASNQWLNDVIAKSNELLLTGCTVSPRRESNILWASRIVDRNVCRL